MALRRLRALRFGAGPVTFRTNFHSFPGNAPAAKVAQAVKSDGYAVIKSFISPRQAASLNTELEAALSAVTPGRAAVAAPDAIPGDDETHKALYGGNTRRVADLLTNSKTFREEVLDLDSLHIICDEVLKKQTGEYWLSTAQMIDMGPGSKAQPLHADGAGWWPFWVMPKDRYLEYYLNFLIATTDTTCENGATGVVNGSHRKDYLAVENLADVWKYPEDQVEQVELRAGDCLLIGGRIVHGGGENKTANERRRILSCMMLSSSLTPEEAHAITVDRDLVKDLPERTKKILGYRSMRPIVGPGVWLHPKGDLSQLLGF